MIKQHLSGFTKTPFLFAALVIALTLPFMSLPDITHAVCNLGTRCDLWGTPELSAANWYSGGGVTVYSNGLYATYNPNKPDNYINNVNSVSTKTGEEWQCVELINRFYLTKGWTTDTWTGNGNSLKDNLPNNTFTFQAYNAVTSINPGDTFTFDGQTYGHAAVVNTIDASGNIQLVSQNSQSTTLSASWNSTTHVISSSALGNLYTVQGIIHRPTPPPPPPADSDGDGVPNTQDACPYTPGLPTNRGCPKEDHTVTGTFYSGDPNNDIVSFYDLGGNNLGAYLFRGQATDGVGQFTQQWATGPGTWIWGSSKFVSGHFTTNSSYTDVIGFYDYGNAQIGAWLFPGTATGLGTGHLLWQSAPGTMFLNQTKLLVGNFTGTHNYQDVLAFYDYGGGNLGAFVFPGNGSGIQQQQFLWNTGPNQWYLYAAKYVAGHFNGSSTATDIMAFYDLGNANMGSYLFAGTTNGVQQPVQKWTTGTGQFFVSQADFLPGKFYSAGSNTDIVSFYDYGGNNMGAFLFAGNGNGVNTLGSPLWTTGPGTWIWSETKPFAGNFVSNGTTSGIVSFYDYGNSDTGAFLYPSNGSGISPAQSLWRTGPGQWTWASM